MSAHDMPGPGDESTWPKCAGHPGDPRTDIGDDDSSLTLKLGDADAEVFYTPTSDLYAQITGVSLGSCDVDLQSFSRWQLESWAASIRKHLLALADEAREAEHYDRLAELHAEVA